MNSKPSQKTRLLLLSIALAMSSSAALHAQVIYTFNSVTGFSGTQGANGWSYAGVHFTGASNLRANQIVATYNSGTSTWNAQYPGSPGVFLSASQQNKFGGNAVFSLRYWTADQDYESVSFTSVLDATTRLTAHVYYSTTLSQTSVAYQSVNTSPQTVNLNGTVNNVHLGDRFYFSLQNIGGTEGSEMQTWTANITATVPEPSTVAMLGGALLLLGLRRCSRVRRGTRTDYKSHSAR